MQTGARAKKRTSEARQCLTWRAIGGTAEQQPKTGRISTGEGRLATIMRSVCPSPHRVCELLLALEILGHGFTNEILEGACINFVTFMDVNGSPNLALKA